MSKEVFLERLIDNLKNALAFGKKSFIGIDIGLSSIKVAQVQKKKNGSYKLTKFSTCVIPEGALIEDEVHNEDDILEALREVLEEVGVDNCDCCIGLSGPSTFARRLQLAGGTEEEINDQVMWEAEQYIPFDIDEAILSHHVFGQNEGGGMDVLVVAAKKQIVDTFKELVEKVKVKVKVIDLHSLAVINVFDLISSKELKKDCSYIVMDIGAQKTSLVIFRNGRIIFVKEMEIGGLMVTEEIQRQMGVNYSEAEDLKTNVDENGNLPEEVVDIIDEVLDTIFSDVKKTIDFYLTSSSDESLTACYVTGGCTLLPGLIEGIEALLGMEIKILNIFDGIEYDKKNIDEDDLENIAYRGVAALGLAMRDLSL